MAIRLSTTHLILREPKPGKIEIVCRATGKARIIAKLDEPVDFLDLPIAKGYLPFGERPIESLEKLRELRTTVILDYRKAKAKDKKAKTKKARGPSKPRMSGLKKRLEAKLAAMPPNLAAIMRKELEKCRKVKDVL